MSSGSGDPLRAGDLIHETYLVEGLIGHGGMGAVYKAINQVTGSPVAIKVMLDEHRHDTRIFEMFRREAQALQKIRHPAVVRYEGTLSHNGVVCLVMEFVEGRPLSYYIAQGARLAAADVMLLGERLASGLRDAHVVGIAHRDLSPDNVLLPGERVADAVLIDFGIAKQVGHAQGTVVGDAFAGKVRYASPEQLGHFGRDVDARTDVYTLGLLLAETAGLDLPVMTEDFRDAMAVRLSDVELPADTPTELREPLARMLVADPARREPDIVKAWTGQDSGMATSGRTVFSDTASGGASMERTRGLNPPQDGAEAKRGAGAAALIAAAVALAVAGAGVGAYFHYGAPPLSGWLGGGGGASSPAGTDGRTDTAASGGRFKPRASPLARPAGDVDSLADASAPEASGELDDASRQAAEILKLQDEQAFQRAVDLMERGEHSALRAAQSVFKGLYRRNHALATRMLGEMHDPNLYSPKTSPESGPDVAKAVYWYQRAAKLGDGTSQLRLRRLGS